MYRWTKYAGDQRIKGMWILQYQTQPVGVSITLGNYYSHDIRSYPDYIRLDFPEPPIQYFKGSLEEAKVFCVKKHIDSLEEQLKQAKSFYEKETTQP